ncbi:hypothetical protein T11_17740 [Trichinella zimbabwensis]|uniref:Uncharacterized protein n=1 Tax=Trichinella zimbabwensis TaxID=268475 RepID=A0A0V1GQB2_9BILA|nr:hypothetical protein T11_1918 [Trichinella zimbabwensis]KRZ00509.1 hypothetical protein T11_17740 [Trichinella zimbabwensis]
MIAALLRIGCNRSTGKDKLLEAIYSEYHNGQKTKKNGIAKSKKYYTTLHSLENDFAVTIKVLHLLNIKHLDSVEKRLRLRIIPQCYDKRYDTFGGHLFKTCFNISTKTT